MVLDVFVVERELMVTPFLVVKATVSEALIGSEERSSKSAADNSSFSSTVGKNLSEKNRK